MHPTEQNLEKIGLRGVFLNFFRSEAVGGILLFIAAVLAMIVANSPLSDMYIALWNVDVGVELAGLGEVFPWLFEHHRIFIGFSLHHWISDVLMALFFLMVGLEIKREVLFGELASVKKAMFPALAALGGMLVPGAIYFALNVNTPSAHGFGIPMATDIAFALGVIMLLKSRVPMALKVFLVTLAVVDDLGAIVVIAVFYTSTLQYGFLALAAVLICALITLNRCGVKALSPYLCVGVALWFAVHHSGIHATISAVILAFCIPVRPKFNRRAFTPHVSAMVGGFVHHKIDEQVFLNEAQLKILRDMRAAITMVQSPLGRLERALHPWSAYCIMPLFGFANAGVRLEGVDMAQIFGLDYIFLGVVLGLLIGKPVGIFCITFICEKLGIAARPSGITWREILGAGMLAGIGFTMSIFVSDLAFKGAIHAQEATEISKIAILSGSILSGIVGATFLILGAKTTKKNNNEIIN